MEHEKIFQVEEYMERSFKAVLESCGVKNAYRSREKQDAQTPWVEVKFLTGAATAKHVHIFEGSKLWVYSAWENSRLEWTVTTQRENNGDQHKVLLGRCRLESQMYRLLNTWPKTDAASVHVIADIREEGTVHSFDSDNNFDFTTLTFHVLHNIVDAAFAE